MPQVAVLGTGSIGMRHLRVLQQVSGVRPMAIPIRVARLREMEQAGYTSAKSLDEAARLGATLCIIATDTGRHVKDGLAAIECGLDVLVEKPLATNACEASRLNGRVKETRRKLFVGCVMRFSESLGIFHNLLERLGRLHSVRIECQSYLPDWRPGRHYRESYAARADEGGVLRDLIHEIDYAGWLFGWPSSVQARMRNLGRLGIEAEEAVDLMWETPQGCLISVSLDYLSRPSRRCMRAVGECGTLEWDGIAGTVSLALSGDPVTVTRVLQTRNDMLLAQDQAFIKASRGYSVPHLATGEDGVKALAVCDAARCASARRREEPVEYP